MHIERVSSDWAMFPNGTRAEGHLFVVPDVHGQSDLLAELLAEMKAQPGAAQATIVFLGDLIDRGPNGIAAFRMAMDAKKDFSRHVILPGNHEGMMLDALDQPLETGSFEFWAECGGFSVLDELDTPTDTAMNAQAALAATLPWDILQTIRAAPSHYVCGDLTMVHAGMRPPIGPAPAQARQSFLNQPLNSAGKEHWAWIRRPFLNWTDGWDAGRREVIVHGHTILANRTFDTVEEAVLAADSVETHARLSLDMGAYAFGQLLGLEVIGDRYRFHLITKRRYLP